MSSCPLATLLLFWNVRSLQSNLQILVYRYLKFELFWAKGFDISKPYCSKMAANDERFLVSGWEDDLNDIDESRNPEGKLMWSCLEQHT